MNIEGNGLQYIIFPSATFLKLNSRFQGMSDAQGRICLGDGHLKHFFLVGSTQFCAFPVTTNMKKEKLGFKDE